MVNVGDRIRIFDTMMGHIIGTSDYTVERFRDCLGVFMSDDDRKAQNFTPLCELYEPSPNSEEKYIPNYGTYHTEYVQSFMQLPSEEKHND